MPAVSLAPLPQPFAAPAALGRGAIGAAPSAAPAGEPGGPARGPAPGGPPVQGAAPGGLVDGATLTRAQDEPARDDEDPDGDGLAEEDEARVRELKQADAEIRRHEQAHAAAGGQHAGAPSFSYERGPDGRQYAVAGEVSIDASAVPGDPDATIRKMDQVIRAALAPAEPSGQDRAVAAAARATQAQARVEQSKQETEERQAEESGEAAGAEDAPGGPIVGAGGRDARAGGPFEVGGAEGPFAAVGRGAPPRASLIDLAV